MQISPSIHAIRHPFKIPITPNSSIERFVYSYLIYGETITLVDTGVAGGEVQIFETIRSSGRSPSEIALIVLTHSHPDHIGSASVIQQKTGCSIAAHPAERAWIEDIDLQSRKRPVPGFATLVGGSVNIDHELVEGDSIEPDRDPGRRDAGFCYTRPFGGFNLALYAQRRSAFFRRCDPNPGRNACL